jgi:hypothetical protein
MRAASAAMRSATATAMATWARERRRCDRQSGNARRKE